MADETNLQTFRFCPVQAVLDTLDLISVANPEIDFAAARKIHADADVRPRDHGLAQEMLRAVGRTVEPALYGKILEHVFISGSAAGGAAESLFWSPELKSLGLTFQDLKIDPERHIHRPLSPMTEADARNLSAIGEYFEARSAIAELEGHDASAQTMDAWRQSLQIVRSGRR